MIPKRKSLFRNVFAVVSKRFQYTGSGFNYHNVINEKIVHEYVPKRFGPLRLTRYGGMNTVTMLPGGGIGPEMMDVVKRVFEETRAPVVFEEINMSPLDDVVACNAAFTQGLMSIRRNGVAIKGHIETQKCDLAHYSRNVALRRNLDLYVNVISYRSYPGISKAFFEDIDLVVVRQNTEGEYMMLEHEPVKGLVENMKIVTEYNSERIARYAFEYARMNGRRNVLCVHRKHVLPRADGLFADTTRRIAAEYADIGYNEKSVSSTIRGLTKDPTKYDVIVCTNLSGSMLKCMLFGMMGSPALFSSRNYGDQYAVFEAGHRNQGSSMKGKGVANPVSMLHASVDLLRYLGHDYHACLIGRAIDKTINDDKVHTFDMGGTATTDDIVENILKRVADAPCKYPFTKPTKPRVYC